MFGISTVLTTLGGIVLGGIKEAYLRAQDAKIAERHALMEKAGLAINDRKDARKMGTGFQFAKRLIVLTFMAIILAPVVLVFMNPSTTFNVPVQMSNGAWSFLFGLFSSSPTEGVQYLQLQGYVYVLAILDMCGLIVGFYMDIILSYFIIKEFTYRFRYTSIVQFFIFST